MNGFVALADGTVWRGESVGADGVACGEAVFTTGMSGYQEAVTDPSFAEQVICFTAPMVGNYGVAETRDESAHAQARAVLMREARGPEWTDWLRERGVVGLTGIDTRSLVLHLRERGAMQACVVGGEHDVDKAVRIAASQPDMAGRALVDGVSTGQVYEFTAEGRARIAVVDYGVKRSVLKRLANARAHVTVFPHDADADELARYDGVLLSPGPGDPAPLVEQTKTVEALLGRTNVFGICLGHQLIAQATGHETFKLPFGHRGINHPVLHKESGTVLVTSQNHGFAVRAAGTETSHISLYDETVEGLEYPELRARSIQFHPEAGPGPHDAYSLIDRWVDQVADDA
ncbi:MAG: glutamine-hydrolyzing carbamoyl-phosphate synthase small subunit [Actinomycetota bacterium]